MDDGFIKIIDNLDELLIEVLNNGDTLTTPKEGQMLINIKGVSINKKQRKDGRYQGYVTNTDGTKKYFYAKSREAITDKIKIYLLEEKKGKEKEKKKITPTFIEYTNNWIELYKQPNLKISSLTILKESLKPALLAFSNKRLNKITADDIQKLLLSIKAKRMRDMCKNNLNQIFKKAYKSGIIKNNPCENIEIKNYQYKHIKGLTLKEQEQFVSAIQKSKYSLLFRLLLSTGLRIGEALALTKSDINTKNHTISISKDVVFIDGKRIIQTPKTQAAIRIIPITKQLCEELNIIETDILFPYTYNSIRLALRKIAKSESIEVSAHILRHTYSIRLEEAGIPPKIKQYLLGHTKLDVTQNTYTEAQEQYIETYSNNIRQLFDTKN
ncbi:MAG: tyrosine-type recombinase/integrase [Candidatus Coproplasma sp.]